MKKFKKMNKLIVIVGLLFGGATVGSVVGVASVAAPPAVVDIVDDVDTADAYLTNCSAWRSTPSNVNGGVTSLCTGYSGSPGVQRAVATCYKAFDPNGTIVYRYGPFVGLGSYSHVWCTGTYNILQHSMYQLG